MPDKSRKKIGPTAAYAWDKDWSIEWNVPREAVDRTRGRRDRRYEHNLVIKFDIQDEERKPIRETSRRITLLTTDEMLDLKERLDILSTRAIREKIIESLARTKGEITGYEMEGIE